MMVAQQPPPAGARLKLVVSRRRLTKTEANAIVLQHMRLAQGLARRMRVKTRMEAEDLEQAALEGLVRAAQVFEPDRGVPFEAYAVHQIRYRLSRELRARKKKEIPTSPEITASLADGGSVVALRIESGVGVWGVVVQPDPPEEGGDESERATLLLRAFGATLTDPRHVEVWKRITTLTGANERPDLASLAAQWDVSGRSVRMVATRLRRKAREFLASKR